MTATSTFKSFSLAAGKRRLLHNRSSGTLVVVEQARSPTDADLSSASAKIYNIYQKEDRIFYAVASPLTFWYKSQSGSNDEFTLEDEVDN